VKPLEADKVDFGSYWRFQCYVWGFQGISTFVYLTTCPQSFQWSTIFSEVGKIVALAPISHFIARTALARGWSGFKRRKLILTWSIACLVGGLVPATLLFPLSLSAYGADGSSKTSLFLSSYFYNITILVMWASFFLAFVFYQRNSRSEVEQMQLRAATKEAQLATLKNQLNPHFLFNSFNVLRTLVQKEPSVAREAITHLSDLMRHSLQFTNADTIKLSHELEFVNSYLTLERLRFEERLRVSCSVPDDSEKISIPSMLVYTLIDNAVKYGIDQNRSGVDIEYALWSEGDSNYLRVTNTGRLVVSGSSTGTGLSNITSRLSLLYGARASLEIFERDGRVVVDVTWPR